MTEEAPSTSGIFYTSHMPQKVEITEEKSHLSAADYEKKLDVEGTIAWISANGYSRIALQFPDSQLGEAVPVAQSIERTLGSGIKTFILADTSYRSCCVDKVAARHATCDALVHYGDACLSAPTQTIPVRYVLGRSPVSHEAMKTTLSSIGEEDKGEGEVAVLLTDSEYAWDAENLAASASVALGRPVLPCALPAGMQGATEQKEGDGEEVCLGRTLPRSFASATSALLVFVGSESSSLLPLWLLTHPQCSIMLHFDPERAENDAANGVVQKPTSWRGLRRRLFLVERVRDAHTIGLVVGTVGVAGHRTAVDRIRALARAQGKKVYVISVGKVNVAKLANFSADIDCFVLLSCPFGVLLDTTSFDKPVVSLFEAEIALNDHKLWMADRGWTAEFGAFVNDPTPSDGPQKADDDDVPDMSLVSGRVRVRPDKSPTTEGEGDEAGTEDGKTVALYTAGDYFAARSWRGLDDSVRASDEEESTTIRDGRRGRAAGYENEP